MNLNLAIRTLFPDAVLDRDYTLQDDGEGPYISSWTLNAPQPTDAEMSDALATAMPRTQIDGQMAAFEREPGNYMTERGLRELVLNLALSQAAITPEMLDPDVALDEQGQMFLALPYVAQRAALVERQMRVWRAERDALGG